MKAFNPQKKMLDIKSSLQKEKLLKKNKNFHNFNQKQKLMLFVK